MRAMLLDAYGPEYEFVMREIPRPKPAPGEVLIKVAGTSFNPLDHKIAAAGFTLGFAPPLPALLGLDVAGVVVEAGSGISRFQPGDRVYGCAGGVGSLPGALAEYMVADERLLAPAPETMALADAACLPLVAITAWLGVFERARVGKEERMLVHGGAGGVGHMAVQLGVYAGAEVYATVSSIEKGTVVDALGAIPVNYYEVDAATYTSAATDGQGFDVVFDTVGGEALDTSFEAAAVGGRIVSTMTRAEHDLAPMHAKGLSLHVVFMPLPLITGEGRPRYGEILGEVARLVDDEHLAVLLDDNCFEFTDIGAAHEYWLSGQAMGKISVVVPEY